MTQAPVVVVIPAYRAEVYIDAALRSVAEQRLGPAEVIVVDDGSPDRTATIAAAWADRLPLTVITQPNGGPAAARRRAIAESSSPLIALLDADDEWLPDHLATMIRTYEEVGGIVTADAIPFRERTASTPVTRRQQKPVPPADQQLEAVLRDNFVFIGSLFDREDHDRAGGFRDGFTGAEDWDLWIRLIRDGVVVHGAPGPTVRYRIASGSLTRRSEVYDRYIGVLEAAKAERASDRELRVIDERLRWMRHRRALARALEAARTRDRATARRSAREAFGGSPRISVEATALLVAPFTTAALSDRVRRRSLR